MDFGDWLLRPRKLLLTQALETSVLISEADAALSLGPLNHFLSDPLFFFKRGFTGYHKNLSTFQIPVKTGQGLSSVDGVAQ